MPFTLSHPAAVIPFARGRFVVPALIIGSMSPDVLYFLPYQPQSHFTHTLPGLFTFCLPTSLVLLLIYRRVLEQPFLSLLPTAQRKPLRSNHVGWLLGSILLGAVSHLFWDSFTHDYGLGVLLFPMLERAFNLGGEQLPVYKLLQYLSTVLGFLICLIWLVQSLKVRRVNDVHRHLWLMIMLAISIGLFYGATFAPLIRLMVVQTGIGAVSSFALLFFSYSLFWHIKRFRFSQT